MEMKTVIAVFKTLSLLALSVQALLEMGYSIFPPSGRLSVSLSVSPSVSPSACLHLCLSRSVSLSICLSVCLSLSVALSVSVSLSVSLSLRVSLSTSVLSSRSLFVFLSLSLSPPVSLCAVSLPRSVLLCLYLYNLMVLDMLHSFIVCHSNGRMDKENTSYSDNAYVGPDMSTL